MSHRLGIAVLVLACAGVCARAADDKALVGEWEGKSAKSGKTVGVNFKADHSMATTEDGKSDMPPGATAKWEVVDMAKGQLDFILTLEGKEVRLPMIMELKDGKLKIGGPKEDGKRPASMADADDPVEFTKK